jgi:hypothetical protein
MTYEHIASGQHVEAERFDFQGPLPAGMVVWDRSKNNIPVPPRDGSWGYIRDHDNSPIVIFQGDFIVRAPGTIHVYREGMFHTLFRKVKT